MLDREPLLHPHAFCTAALLEVVGAELMLTQAN